jgi:micrococcal nuclease
MYTYPAKIIRVYDGDTVIAIVDLGFHTKKEIKIRLAGIDTPELRKEERPQGIVSKERMSELILNKDVVLKTYKDKQEKYGRWLGEIFLPDSKVSVNQIMINEGLAKPYYS